AMASVGCQVVIQLYDVGVELGWGWICEGRCSNVKAIATTLRVVRNRIVVEHRQGGGINSGPLGTSPKARAKRIHILEMGRGQREQAGGGTILGADVALISQKTLAQIRGGHQTGDNRSF